MSLYNWHTPLGPHHLFTYPLGIKCLIILVVTQLCKYYPFAEFVTVHHTFPETLGVVGRLTINADTKHNPKLKFEKV